MMERLPAVKIQLAECLASCLSDLTDKRTLTQALARCAMPSALHR